MKCIRILIVLMAVMFGQGVAFAQEGGQTEDTHAHSESHKWKGIDVNTVLDTSNPEYKPEYATKGKTIFLFNIGTGRFIINGGNHAMEGRLFFEDFGRPLFLLSNGFIRSGITESSNENKQLFGCNVPGIFHSQGNWTNWNQYSFTVMMDADKSKRNYNGAGWQFERVQGETGDTCTYYMYERKNNKNYYLGAAYGECNAADWKGVGTRVSMNSDRACWTTEDPRRDDTKYDVDGDMITIDELYQWRVVSEKEFYDALNEDRNGLNPSVSILIKDRDFTRNAENFDTYWVTERKADNNYTENGRRGFSYGVYLNNTKQKDTYNNEPWNMPIRLKNVFDNNKNVTGTNDLAYSWENAKNGFLTFEGVGRTYTLLEVPQPGWYQVQCYGFVQSNDNDAYLFAKIVNEENTQAGRESKANITRVPADTFGPKNLRDSCLSVGKKLTDPKLGFKDKHLNTVWICVTEDDYNSGMKYLQVGVGKDDATKSVPYNNKYYYDTDWVCIDDFRMSYLGLRPAFFYEEEEDLDYLIPGEDNTKQYLGASPTGEYCGAMCLERTLKTNEWNSFSFPLPLTGEQMRQAFGEEAELAFVHSIGKMSNNPNVIDFKTISLRTTKTVVEPGHFYLLKPTKEPTEGYDPQGRFTTFYELGRYFFSVNDNESEDYKHERLPLSTLMVENLEDQAIESLDGKHDGFMGVNYVQTPGFDDFKSLVSKSDGLYTGDAANGIYAKKDSYVVSDNTIVHLNKDNRLKGFRGWIKLDQPISLDSKEISMFGMFDEEPEHSGTNTVPRIHLLSSDESVYDLFGRKVGILGDTLPKGIYIVKGKKYMVK